MKTVQRIIIALLAVVFLAAVFRTVAWAYSPPRPVCIANMSQIALALLNYENQKGHFPPPYTVDENGKPLHSWRTLLLPYLEYNQLFDKIRFDEPWDSEYNKQFHDVPIPIFHCRSAKPRPAPTSPLVYYDIVIGPNTAFPPFDGEKQPKVSLDEICSVAGTGYTILLVEHKAPVHWMQPSGIDVNDLHNEIDWRHGEVACFAFADRLVRPLWKKITPDALKRLCEWKDHQHMDPGFLVQALKENDGWAIMELEPGDRILIVQLVTGFVLFTCLAALLMVLVVRLMIRRLRKSRPSGNCGAV